MEKKRILVAMSGGVDSSVAAAILKEQGHDVAGATIRTWASNSCEDLNTRACCGLTGVEDARSVAENLDIPYWVFNFEKPFKKFVVDYFASEYERGRTPNPCIACNEHVKFRLFLKRARQLGYEAIATGHYAQLHHGNSPDSFYIAEGIDAAKDQSYVLFPLDRDVLAHLFLPLGHFTKSAIREKAKQLNLCVMDKPDSQEICFIPSNDYATFLDREYQAAEKIEAGSHVGKIRTRDGRVLGEHQGHYHYTRGQRRGLGIPHSERLYVVEIDPKKNEVIVGTKEEVFDVTCTVRRMNWFLPPEGDAPIRAHVKIRSQHQKALATLTVGDDGAVEVHFDDAQDAITPGQAAVFYDDTKVIGGGWIG
ncbi:MAG: tRNA 2-thiouridine(34) synthase MnmA [Candidatus Omnitrophota bacterium]|nr:tRNA 2-thiouridine(34) synthase MnmA [Candidatus Omnitrophota bacterium]